VTDTEDSRTRNAAIVVAHPGHELVVHHWLTDHTPLYFCLTDGSGGSAQSRLGSTATLLENAGARRGSIFGRYTDKAAYRLLLDRDATAFVAMRDELAESLRAAAIACVSGDAMEGFNPIHDVCRAIIDAAVLVIHQQTGRELENYEFALHSGTARAPQPSTDGIVLRLDEAALQRKLAAASAYPEMRAEVQAALDEFGRQAFAVERLQPSSAHRMIEEFERTPPLYDRHGEIRVGQGVYTDAIRYREHVLPVLLAIGEL
jgi:hypothetical protein